MKKMNLIALMTLVALVAGACKKEAPANANTAAAKPTNASPAPAATPTPVAAKASVKPVSTEGNDNIYEHAEGGIKFEAPASWKAEADGDVMTLTTADSSLSVVFWVPKEGTVEESLHALSAELGKVIKNIKSSGEPEKGTLNGMTVYTVEGTGDVNGATIEWSCHLMGAKKPVIALTFAAPGAYEKHEKDVDTFIKSIKKSN